LELNMLKSLGCALVAFTLASPVSAAAGELRLSIANGRVTLVAQEVSLKQILDEWARVGQTTVIGAERLLGQSVTLELQDVPEARALETLLRSASGYIAKPRTVALATGGSTYDRIMIMAASRAPAASSVPQQFNRPPQQMFNPPLMPDEDEPGNTVLPPGALPPGAIGQMNGPQPMTPQSYPGAPPIPQGIQGQPPNGVTQQPLTAPRPGQLPTPMPAFPANPYQMPPQQGQRPPGGGGGQ
jgi:hypothetical protein